MTQRMKGGCRGLAAFGAVTVAVVGWAAMGAMPGCSGTESSSGSNENVAVADLKVVEAGVLDAAKPVPAPTPVQDPCEAALAQAAPTLANVCCDVADSNQGAFDCIADSCENGCKESSPVQVCANENGVEACENACRGAGSGYLTGEILNGKKCGVMFADASTTTSVTLAQ